MGEYAVNNKRFIAIQKICNDIAYKNTKPMSEKKMGNVDSSDYIYFPDTNNGNIGSNHAINSVNDDIDYIGTQPSSLPVNKNSLEWKLQGLIKLLEVDTSIKNDQFIDHFRDLKKEYPVIRELCRRDGNIFQKKWYDMFMWKSTKIARFRTLVKELKKGIFTDPKGGESGCYFAKLKPSVCQRIDMEIRNFYKKQYSPGNLRDKEQIVMNSLIKFNTNVNFVPNKINVQTFNNSPQLLEALDYKYGFLSEQRTSSGDRNSVNIEGVSYTDLCNQLRKELGVDEHVEIFNGEDLSEPIATKIKEKLGFSNNPAVPRNEFSGEANIGLSTRNSDGRKETERRDLGNLLPQKLELDKTAAEILEEKDLNQQRETQIRLGLAVSNEPESLRSESPGESNIGLSGRNSDIVVASEAPSENNSNIASPHHAEVDSTAIISRHTYKHSSGVVFYVERNGYTNVSIKYCENSNGDKKEYLQGEIIKDGKNKPKKYENDSQIERLTVKKTDGTLMYVYFKVGTAEMVRLPKPTDFDPLINYQSWISGKARVIVRTRGLDDDNLGLFTIKKIKWVPSWVVSQLSHTINPVIENFREKTIMDGIGHKFRLPRFYGRAEGQPDTTKDFDENGNVRLKITDEYVNGTPFELGNKPPRKDFYQMFLLTLYSLSLVVFHKDKKYSLDLRDNKPANYLKVNGKVVGYVYGLMYNGTVDVSKLNAGDEINLNLAEMTKNNTQFEIEKGHVAKIELPDKNYIYVKRTGENNYIYLTLKEDYKHYNNERIEAEIKKGSTLFEGDSYVSRIDLDDLAISIVEKNRLPGNWYEYPGFANSNKDKREENYRAFISKLKECLKNLSNAEFKEEALDYSHKLEVVMGILLTGLFNVDECNNLFNFRDDHKKALNAAGILIPDYTSKVKKDEFRRSIEKYDKFNLENFNKLSEYITVGEILDSMNIPSYSQEELVRKKELVKKELEKNIPTYFPGGVVENIENFRNRCVECLINWAYGDNHEQMLGFIQDLIKYSRENQQVLANILQNTSVPLSGIRMIN
ncbi:MAG: hypothetical protein KBD37_06085 [Burkholderiales bacterium]|nr:hypothetical protein [Burkholderiales bacterium]